MADIGSVWASGSWSTSAWAAGTWADASTVVPTGGVVWIMVNGVMTPPATAVQGTQANWMCVNGAWVIPAVKIMPWPRYTRSDK